MTPERKAWWDSLPKEEKRVRLDIKELRTQIAWHKIGLKSSYGHETEMRKFALRMNKRLIKALRKQIAMRPVIKKEFKMFRYCPTCDCILNVSRTSPNCDRCGQKLRWKKCVD